MPRRSVTRDSEVSDRQIPAPSIEVLTRGTSYPFSEGLHESLPHSKPGVYTIWRHAEFVYVGIAGRSLDPPLEQKSSRGLRDRLRSHYTGRRSGDQFCIYVCDRLVLSSLSAEQINQVVTGSLSLDALTRSYIHQHLGYRFCETETYRQAMLIETFLADGRHPIGRPVLNPRQVGVRKAAGRNLSAKGLPRADCLASP
jgi:hypothetical protein